MHIDSNLTSDSLTPAIARVFQLAADKVRSIDRTWDANLGAPVFTEGGQYTRRGWTEWTEGFLYGNALLAYEASGDADLLELGRRRTVERMATHVTHQGVHDHGFNNLSTYGNLRRLMREGRIPENEWELAFYELALRASGAVQASRWSFAGPRGGYIYSFNGPHSLFIDTLRTLRVLGVAHQLGHVLMGENDDRISLLGRLIRHALTSAQYLVWYGEDRDAYDIRGRTSHEGLFNLNDGRFRCPSTQQGYSPFSTWTRGLAWAMLGFAEQREFIGSLGAAEIQEACGETKDDVLAVVDKAASATCDYYINHAAAADGVCYWDTGAPNLHQLGDYLARPSDPFNAWEPVDSSAAAIAAQGLLRWGHVLGDAGEAYRKAGLTVARTLMDEPYLSTKSEHQGLLLHAIYHRPNGWDSIPHGESIPCGESCLWGDYHLLELAIYLSRLGTSGAGYYTFFDA